jgi:hypothetical protein
MSQKGRSENLTYRGVLCNAVVAERKAAGAASDLFKLARRAADQDEWEAHCQVEEEWLLSDEAGQMKCVELPKCWTQARSDIRGAFRAGLDLKSIPSYHKLKVRKAEVNKAKREESSGKEEPIVVPSKPAAVSPAPEADGPVTVEVKPADGRTRRFSGQRDERGPRVDGVVTVDEALEAGDVVDAKSNMIVPDDMRQLMVLLSKLPEHGRARLIKQWTKEAQRALAHVNNKGGSQHAATA